MATSKHDISLWRRLLAYWWYAWAMSLCYWGIRTTERSLYQAGVRSFDRALRAWPEFAGAYYRRGVIRGRELREYSEGIADLGRAIQLMPDWAEPYLQRGLLERFHGDPRAALADLHRFLELGGSAAWNAEATQQIAQIKADLGQDSVE